LRSIEQLVEALVESYLPRARWWPWRGERRPIELVDWEDSGSLLMLIFRCGERLFQLPLLRVGGLPAGLESRGFCLEDSCYVEAEYTSRYLREVGGLRGFKYKAIATPLEDVEVDDARPLTFESTSAIAVYVSRGRRLLLKSYRLVPSVDVEVRVLEHLARSRFRYMPLVHGVLYYKSYPSGVLVDYVEGRGDGGYPFYQSLVKHLGGDRASLELGLAAKVGVITAELHLSLNVEEGPGFFAIEEISSGDVERWASRIWRMYNEAIKRVDEHLASASSSTRESLERWRSLAERGRAVVEEAVSLIERLYVGEYKGRAHQDLHLGRMVYVGDGRVDFVITDFEGEPWRSPEERLEKEPVVKDVASLIRSFHRLSHAAIMEAYKLTRDEASELMSRGDPTLEWRVRHVVSMTYSYVARLTRTKLLPARTGRVRPIGQLLYPWIVERAVYELLYESTYRPTWISIPIVGLLEAEVYKRAV
jgi:hypothetical protein